MKRTKKQRSDKVRKDANHKWEFLSRDPQFKKDRAELKRLKKETPILFDEKLKQMMTKWGVREVAFEGWENEFKKLRNISSGEFVKSFTAGFLNSPIKPSAREVGEKCKSKVDALCVKEVKNIFGVDSFRKVSCGVVMLEAGPHTNNELRRPEKQTLHSDDPTIFDTFEIAIDVKRPKEVILSEIDKAIDVMQEHRGMLFPDKKQPRFSVFEEYLEIYDLNQQKLSLAEIAKQVYPADYKKIDQHGKASVLEKVRRNLEQATALVNGGHKNLP